FCRLATFPGRQLSPGKSSSPVLVFLVVSKEELIVLVDRIEFGALDDVISGLTNAERQAAHALVLELARGFDYVNLNSDTSSEEPIRVTPGMVSHIDDIVQSVSIQDKPSSYVGAAGGSTPKPSKTKAKFCSLSSENLCEGIDCSIPRKVVETVFSEDDLSIIVSQIGKPIMLDSYTSSMCIESWGRSSFARCLIEINANGVLKKSLNVGVPLIEGLGFTIERVNIEYKPKTTANVPMKGATNVSNASKFGMSQVSSLLKKQPPKAIVPSTKEGNITMFNSYAAFDDENEEEVDNMYDESANLLNSTKTCGSSSSFTVAAG
ncbi:hypothetical protein Tco_0900745, partial [Tanacetum coccineum]